MADTATVQLESGREVSLLGISQGRAHAATVRSWDVGPGGVVVTAHVRTEPETAAELADHRVWLSTVSSAEDQFGVTIFEAIAQPTGPGELRLTGVIVRAREPRRTSVRTPGGGVAVLGADRGRVELKVVDLSRGGIRVAMEGVSDLAVGESVRLELHLDDGQVLPTIGTVSRVAEASRQAVIRFIDLVPGLADRIDRFVLLRSGAAG